MKKVGLMKNLFKIENIKFSLTVLALLLVIKLSWFSVQVLFLSVKDIDQAKDQSTKALYYRAKLTPRHIPAPIKKVKKTAPKIVGSIKEITLLAIYNDEDISVITIFYKKRSKVLGIGDIVNNFIFEGAGINFAMFSRNDENYKVMLAEKGKSEVSLDRSSPSEDSEKKPDGPIGEIVNEGSAKIIDRSLIEHYAENMDDIYKNIGIKEVHGKKGLEGFKISFIKHGSPFSKLGIKRNDVIKSINGQAMTDYKAGFSVYKGIKDTENLSIVVVRDNEEMELEYEIN
jgi:general secretion pathway protein C